MVTRVVVETLCDDCLHHGITDVPASGTHTVAIDGGPPRKVSLCARCEHVWQPLIAVYTEQGQDIKEEPKPKPQETKKPVKKEAPKQLEAVKAPEKKGAPEKKRIVCPLDHLSTGGPMEVVYEDRNTHADMVHHGKRIWEIRWGDPHGHFQVYCYEHDFCSGLGFTSKRGLTQHIRYLELHPPGKEDGDAQTEEGT